MSHRPPGPCPTGMSTSARIPLVESGPLVRAMNWWTTRAYGGVMEPALGLAHHRKVLTSSMRYQMAVRRWDAVDTPLKHLATLSAAATVGCGWCLDFGYWVSHSEGVDREKLEAIGDWRTATVYSDLERRVIEYAEAMSTTPVTVTDEMGAALRERLGNAGVVELTAVVALENSYSRTNSALGFHSQGFKDRCEVPSARA